MRKSKILIGTHAKSVQVTIVTITRPIDEAILAVDGTARFFILLWPNGTDEASREPKQIPQPAMPKPRDEHKTLFKNNKEAVCVAGLIAIDCLYRNMLSLALCVHVLTGAPACHVDLRVCT